jgi:spore germination cell wall hydrolase CwlJ-like protein
MKENNSLKAAMIIICVLLMITLVLAVTQGSNVAETDAETLPKLVYGEARGCSEDEWRIVIWTVLQRVDDPRWGDTVHAVVTQRKQFNGYRASNPVKDEIYAVVSEELEKWAAGELPPTIEPYATSERYYYLTGYKGHIWVREEY